ncbi:MAG: DoxX family protein [Bryobacteraceae bacterium]
MTKNRTLWIIQGLLAALFLFAGGVKLVMPAADLAKQAPMLSVGFLRFVAVCEVLGAIGLILPRLLRIQPVLTPLAAAALVVIMIGAVTVTAMMNWIAVALFPLVVGLLLALVAYGRWRRVVV